MSSELEAQLSATLEAILASPQPKKVIVAGPGTGKTYLFKQLLERLRAERDQSLVLTFINNLKNDLERALAQLARVFTFHGYCRHLLHGRPALRRGLTERFHYFPPLASLIKRDWELTRRAEAPRFVGLMRDIAVGESTDFYIDRATYYDAVSFDDSVFRVYLGLVENPENIARYSAVLVDEVQDFNRLEIEFIRLLASRSPTLVAGDDDQALYSLRSSSPVYIRALHAEGEYQSFPLPFCMRCTAPIVGAVGDIIAHARARGNLDGRINKPYLFYPPKKGSDSERYPRIRLVEVSAQSRRINYFGRYIEQQLALIPEEDIRESHGAEFPTALVVGSVQYLRQVHEYLEVRGYPCVVKDGSDPTELHRGDALRILRDRPDANLGWRAVLELDEPPFAVDAIREAVDRPRPLVEIIPADYREPILAEAGELVTQETAVADAPQPNPAQPTIRLTSFEGSKGLSAQQVFIVGLHESEMPRDARHIDDIEICKVLVALTRTRKQCHLLHTWRWSGQRRRPSIFLGWIKEARLERVSVNSEYW